MLLVAYIIDTRTYSVSSAKRYASAKGLLEGRIAISHYHLEPLYASGHNDAAAQNLRHDIGCLV